MEDSEWYSYKDRKKNLESSIREAENETRKMKQDLLGLKSEAECMKKLRDAEKMIEFQRKQREQLEKYRVKRTNELKNILISEDSQHIKDKYIIEWAKDYLQQNKYTEVWFKR